MTHVRSHHAVTLVQAWKQAPAQARLLALQWCNSGLPLFIFSVSHMATSGLSPKIFQDVTDR
ncbi:hypothetical protein SAMN02982919_01606 [Giesbergeria anulus]|uniref:Uncharacterized protein n=1 Tax=Giesbergeria anulus TaxID=180197 RepID=A0A1H9KN64_9BURK|nr:hypothetical protein SAMN02982919_01606 [Giesbergeria anulus]